MLKWKNFLIFEFIFMVLFLSNFYWAKLLGCPPFSYTVGALECEDIISAFESFDLLLFFLASFYAIVFIILKIYYYIGWEKNATLT